MKYNWNGTLFHLLIAVMGVVRTQCSTAPVSLTNDGRLNAQKLSVLKHATQSEMEVHHHDLGMKRNEIFEQVVQIVREKQDEIDELQEQYQKLQETCHQSIPPSSDYFLPSTSMPWLAYILPASMIQDSIIPINLLVIFIVFIVSLAAFGFIVFYLVFSSEKRSVAPIRPIPRIPLTLENSESVRFDVDRENEVVTLENFSNNDFDLTGCELSNSKKAVFAFPEGFLLASHTVVKICSGKSYARVKRSTSKVSQPILDSRTCPQLRWTTSSLWTDASSMAVLLDAQRKCISNVPHHFALNEKKDQ